MAKGDGRGGNHSHAWNTPAHEIGPADITLGRLILLAREGNRQAVREALASISEAEIVLGRAAQCVRAGALQSAIKMLNGEFTRVFGEDAETGLIRQRQSEIEAANRCRRAENMPLAETALTMRIVNGLEDRFGCITVGEVCKFSGDDLILGRRGANIGPVALKQIRAELAKLGLSLRGEAPPMSAVTDDGESDSGE